MKKCIFVLKSMLNDTLKHALSDRKFDFTKKYLSVWDLLNKLFTLYDVTS